MQSVVNEYDEISDYAVKSARIIHSEWSWEAVADKILLRYAEFEKTFN
jgi:hypothetical protein